MQTRTPEVHLGAHARQQSLAHGDASSRHAHDLDELQNQPELICLETDGIGALVELLASIGLPERERVLRTC